jgi:hypothetical protein
MYEFGDNAQDEKSRNFFGHNSGIRKKNSSGILTSQNNIPQVRCDDIGLMSPYFNETV